MGAALTIAVLMAFSVFVVRVASVAMRLTGLAENVARFQCLSALTGTGYTTAESEMIVNYPIRRRILVGLMILGNLGLVSLGATFIVTFVQTGTDSGEILNQAISIAIAITVILTLLNNKMLDRVMCRWIGVILLKITSLGERRYHRLLQLDNSVSIAEHTIKSSGELALRDLQLGNLGLTLLAIRGQKHELPRDAEPDSKLNSGDILICSGPDAAHDDLEDLIEKVRTAG